VLLLGSVVIGQLAAHFLEAHGWTAGAWPYELKIVVKQGAELAGWILITGALLVAAGFPHPRRAVVGQRADTVPSTSR
jgi:hypothetical protein